MITHFSLLIPLLLLLRLPPTALSTPLTFTSAHPTPEIPSSPSLLQPRISGGNLRPVYFNTVLIIEPLPSALLTLTRFYGDLWSYIVLHWGRLPTGPNYIFRVGQFELGLFAGEGDLDWEFVRFFLVNMLEYTRRGYTGTFMTTWTDPGRTQAMSVMLRFMYQRSK